MTKLLLLIVLALFASGSVARPIDHANVSTLRDLLHQPEGGIDMAKAKVAIDGMFPRWARSLVCRSR